VRAGNLRISDKSLEVVTYSRLQIDFCAPASQFLKRSGITDKITSLNRMQIRRFRDVTNFDLTSGHAVRLLRYAYESFDEGVAATRRDDVMPPGTYVWVSDGQPKSIAYIIDVSEIANRGAVAVNCQWLSIDSPPYHGV
jgi:hypothetical protein